VNISIVLEEKNHLAHSERCLALALDLAKLVGKYEDLFSVQLRMFKRLAGAGKVREANLVWDSLNRLGRNWATTQYRSGYAEAIYIRFQLDCGTLSESNLLIALSMAQNSHNRFAMRWLKLLHGEYLLRQDPHQPAAAADVLSDAVRMAHEAGVSDPEAETWLALARYHLGHLVKPDQEAKRLASIREPQHLPLAELWQAIGDTTQAIKHALAAYRHAWADGEPFVHRYELNRAANLLDTLGASRPDFPPYNSACHPQLAWESEIVAAIEALKVERSRRSGSER
jgi:hypothetical protein